MVQMSGLNRLRKNPPEVSFRGAEGDEESRTALKILRARFLAPLGMTAYKRFSAACKAPPDAGRSRIAPNAGEDGKGRLTPFLPHFARFAPARKSTSATSVALACSVLAASSDLPPHQQATMLHSPTLQQDALHISLTLNGNEKPGTITRDQRPSVCLSQFTWRYSRK